MPARALILTAVVAALCLVALVRPRIGLYGYMWYAMMRPDILAWVDDMYPFSMCLALATAAGSLAHAANYGRVFRNPMSRWLALLQIPLALSALAAHKTAPAADSYLEYLKAIAVILLIPVLIETERQLGTLLIVIAASLGFIGLRFGAFALLHGGVVLVNGYGGKLSDNNLLALGLAEVVPLCWYGRQFARPFLLRFALLVMAFGSTVGIVMTNSRGGSLALALVIFAMLRRSRHKLGLAAVLFLVAGGSAYTIRREYVERMETLRAPTTEDSAASRLTHAETALRMWADYPLIGVGFGGQNYVALSRQYTGVEDIHVVHNSYLEMLVDSGIFAFLIYTGLLWGTIVWLDFSVKRIPKEQSGRAAMPLAIQVGLMAFALGGTFYSAQRFDLPYILLMCGGCWREVSRSQPLAGARACTGKS